MSILFNVFIFGIVAGCLYMLYKQDKYISDLITDIDELQEINDTQAGTIRKMMDDVFIHDDAYSDLKEDFLLLAESVDMFLEENDNDTLSDVVSVMDELSDKYSSLKHDRDDLFDSLRDTLFVVENTFVHIQTNSQSDNTDEFEKHVSCYECDNSCGICDTATKQEAVV